jgi:hypothetical protein
MLFAYTSRYYGIPVATLDTAEGGRITYLTRRFVPAPERFSTLQEYSVAGDDRLDRITAVFLNDAEQFWRICDANRALHPDELTSVVGRRLRITLPEGIPGPLNG